MLMVPVRSKMFVSLLVGALSFFFIACSTPSSFFLQIATNSGFHSQVYEGVGFVHQVFSNQQPHNSEWLHIYLGSDGTPWATVDRIASDPTPRNPIMLRMMALDSTASVYVGRPCYHGFSQNPGCHAGLWTSARYSEAVVESLSFVIAQLSKEQEMRGVVLFGYSGGGALAMLVAERVISVKGVVTIAGNLDIEAWTDYHGFSPLEGSINPASLTPLGSHIVQIHFLGSQDQVVPKHLVEKILQRQGIDSRVIVKDVDHQCCWEAKWPRLLREVNLKLD